MLKIILYVSVSGILLAHAWTQCIREGMILDWIGQWLDRRGKWSNALSCSYCFTVWATVLMFVLYTLYFPAWFAITIVTLAMFLNHLLSYNDLID